MSNPSMIGPSLPPHLSVTRSTESNDEPLDVIGPQLPSTNEGKSTKVSYGPSLPPGMTYGPSITEDSKNISVSYFYCGIVYDMCTYLHRKLPC